MGHIELPVPVYHATFMDQTLRLLRARCAYCNHFKLRRADINRFVCKLHLIQYGLLEESKRIELLQTQRQKPTSTTAGLSVGSDVSEDEDTDDGTDDLIERRNDFVKVAIKKAGGRKNMAAIAGDKVESAAEERRAVVKDFMADLTKPKACDSCKGYART